MKQKNKEESNCVKSYTQCIQWNLGDIPSLGITNGDYMDELVYAIVNKLCELSDPLDLSTLSLQCLIDKLNNTEPIPRTIQTVFQLLIDNECSLKDLIDELQNQINDINSTSLTLNLKCLAQYDVYGNPLPYNVQSVLQSLIDEICPLKDTVAHLSTVVVDLQTQINNINVTPYELPSITTCISANKVLDVSVKDIATSLCNLRNATGTEIQLQTAMANQCPNFNNQFGNIVGWNLAPVNLAQSYSNLELAFCDVLNRLIIMETTCCGPTCDKIKLGFSVEVDRDLKQMTFCFTSGAGTYIPYGFYDCGSVITITDEAGNVAAPQTTVISQDGCVSGISYSSLTGKIFFVSIKTKFCLKDREGNLILTCQDCLNKTIDISAECPVCKVCVIGDKTAPQNGYVEITYILNGIYTAVTIFENQCNYIPSDAVVVAIDRYNNATEVTDCLDTTNVEVKKCYQFRWTVTVNSNDITDAWEDSNPNNLITAFNINGASFPTTIPISTPGLVKDFIASSASQILVSGLLSAYAFYSGNRYLAVITFRALPSVAEKMYLTTTIDDSTGLRIYPTEINC